MLREHGVCSPCGCTVACRRLAYFAKVPAAASTLPEDPGPTLVVAEGASSVATDEINTLRAELEDVGDDTMGAMHPIQAPAWLRHLPCGTLASP